MECNRATSCKTFRSVQYVRIKCAAQVDKPASDRLSAKSGGSAERLGMGGVVGSSMAPAVDFLSQFFLEGWLLVAKGDTSGDVVVG